MDLCGDVEGLTASCLIYNLKCTLLQFLKHNTNHLNVCLSLALLGKPKAVVSTADFGNKVIVTSTFDKSTLNHDTNFIGSSSGLQAVSDDQRDATLHELVH
jgi:hypothetical protein